MKNKPYHLVIFASNTGSNFESIAKACINSTLFASVKALITDNPKAKAIEKAKSLSIPYHLFNANDFIEEKKLIDTLNQYSPDFLILAGFLKKIRKKILKRFKVINTHPSLLPKYGGKNMYGIKVHQKVIQSKDLETGITIHQVNEEYDKGQILAQKKVKILKTDTAESLQKRIKPIENQFYIQTLKKIFNQTIRLQNH